MKRPGFKSDFVGAVATLAFMGAFFGLARLGLLGQWGRHVVASARNDELNAVEENAQILSYYDAVQQEETVAGLGGSSVRVRSPEDQIEASGAVELLEGPLRYRLRPDLNMVYRGTPLVTNRWGQRDQDCEKKKPAGTFRIAMVGASNVMGSGVSYEDTFTTILEEQLQSHSPEHGTFAKYEVINFGVNGYIFAELLYVAEHIAPEFHPDLIVICLSRSDRQLFHVRFARYLVDRGSIEVVPFATLRELLAQENVSHASLEDSDVLARDLAPMRDQLVVGCFRELSQIKQRIGIPVVVAMLHLRAGTDPDEDTLWMADESERAGLSTLRVFEAYSNTEGKDMYLSDGDVHPTPRAHRLLADDLLAKLLADPVAGPLVVGKTESETPVP